YCRKKVSALAKCSTYCGAIARREWLVMLNPRDFAGGCALRGLYWRCSRTETSLKHFNRLAQFNRITRFGQAEIRAQISCTKQILFACRGAENNGPLRPQMGMLAQPFQHAKSVQTRHFQVQ